MNSSRLPYRGYRFPPEIISYCVWLYFRFSVSYRDIEELMAERGVTVTYETIRAWCYKFGQDYAKRIRARRRQLGDTWHLDEVCATRGGDGQARRLYAPCAALLPNTVHRRDKGLNNRAENSHQSTRERERRMRGFKSAGHAQRFLSIFGLVADLFGVGRHFLSAPNYRAALSRRFIEWRSIAGVPAAA